MSTAVQRIVVETDAVVIARSLKTPEAFGEVFDRHWDAVYRYCRSRAGAEGEDLAAETFRLAFDRRGAYDLDRPNAGALAARPRDQPDPQPPAQLRPRPARGSATADRRLRGPRRRRHRPRGGGSAGAHAGAGAGRDSMPETAMRCFWWRGATSATRRSPRRWASRSARCAPASAGRGSGSEPGWRSKATGERSRSCRRPDERRPAAKRRGEVRCVDAPGLPSVVRSATRGERRRGLRRDAPGPSRVLSG